jgi:hypothetical protein
VNEWVRRSTTDAYCKQIHLDCHIHSGGVDGERNLGVT